MAKRIDSLKYGQRVNLRFHGRATREEDAIFRGIDGDGEDRRATFEQDGFIWTAYRYQGHWAYGSSADRLQLLEEVAA